MPEIIRGRRYRDTSDASADAGSTEYTTSSEREANDDFHPLRENNAISRDETSGNGRGIENLSAISPQTKRGNLLVFNVSKASLHKHGVQT
jgi:hypothetical protein